MTSHLAGFWTEGVHWASVRTPSVFSATSHQTRPLTESFVQNEAACAQLDGGYTVFGETVKGLDIIDRIAAVETDNRDRPTIDVRIKKVVLANNNNN